MGRGSQHRLFPSGFQKIVFGGSFQGAVLSVFLLLVLSHHPPLKSPKVKVLFWKIPVYVKTLDHFKSFSIPDLLLTVLVHHESGLNSPLGSSSTSAGPSQNQMLPLNGGHSQIHFCNQNICKKGHDSSSIS